MPTSRLAGAIFIVLGVLCVTSLAMADCEGGPVFGYTITALDKDTLGWSSPVDVDYVKGALSRVSSYETTIRSSLNGAISLDIGNENPRPNTGTYFLLKSSSPPCGSWQTVLGAESSRDSGVHPPCSEINPTEEEIESAVAAAVVDLVSPWDNPDEFLTMYDRIQSGLGCALETDPAPLVDGEADCTTNYCSSVAYCGKRNSSVDDHLIFPAGPCLNSECFDHDTCYRTNCVTTDPDCSFSPRSTSFGCEDLWVTACATCPLLDGIVDSNNWRNDLLICSAVPSLLARGLVLGCDDPPCSGSAQVCDSSTGSCAPLVEVLTVPADGSVVWSTTVLEAGATYTIRASGTIVIGGPGDGLGDAEYADFSNPPSSVFSNCDYDPAALDFGLAINDPVQDSNRFPYWGPYSPSHVYTIDFVGEGSAIRLDYHDCGHGDNSGSLTVEIFAPFGHCVSSAPVIWKEKLLHDDCVGPSDGGIPWYDPGFDDSSWGLVSSFPNTWSGPPNDRYFRGYFESPEAGAVFDLSFQSDDGIRFFVNGNAGPEYGNGCHQGGCVNGPPTCGINLEVGPLDLSQWVIPGTNVIGVHVTNAPVGGGGGLFDASLAHKCSTQ